MINKLRNQIRLIIIGWLVLQFFLLAYLTQKYPIPTPITDDWLYLGLGSHQEKLLTPSLVELITGHQQVLVKVVVWISGSFMIDYLQFFWMLNALLVLSGTYLLVMSHVKRVGREITAYQILVMLLLFSNYKALYLYLSITGMGLCMTFFLYGFYYYVPTRLDHKNAKKVQLGIAFVAPFTTGFGMSLTLSHLIFTARPLLKNKLANKKQAWYPILFLLISMVISYLVPTLLKLFNPRADDHSSGFISKILGVLKNPLNDLGFLSGLIGSVLSPSSRLDPQLPIFLGVLLLISGLSIYLLSTRHPAALSNRVKVESTPLLPSLIFMLLLLFFRGSVGSNQLIESTAPRYVLGSSLFLYSCYELLLTNFVAKPKLRSFILATISIILCASFLGIKTGMEWIQLRSRQSLELNECLLVNKNSVAHCIDSATPIRQGESNPEQIRADLSKLVKHNYLRNS